MMITMHSSLADRYLRRAQALEITLLVCSILLVSCTFLDPKVLVYLSVSNESARVVIGLCSVAIFILATTALVVNWKGKATEHKKAFEALIPLKAECRRAQTAENEYKNEGVLDFNEKCSLIMGTLIPIPNSQFSRLKSQHERKVVLSKLISSHPGSSVFLLRFCLWYGANKKAWKARVTN